MDLLTTYAHNSELKTITALSLISTIHKSSQQPLSLFQSAVSSLAVPLQWLLRVEIHQFHVLRFYLHSLPYRTNFLLFITSRHGPHRKHSSSIIAAGTCLPSRCPETALYIRLSRRRCIAMAVHTTILNIKIILYFVVPSFMNVGYVLLFSRRMARYSDTNFRHFIRKSGRTGVGNSWSLIRIFVGICAALNDMGCRRR
jgi:hypothetical protein